MNGLFLEERYPCGRCLNLVIEALLKNRGHKNETESRAAKEHAGR
jgi:hypothetical protein